MKRTVILTSLFAIFLGVSIYVYNASYQSDFQKQQVIQATKTLNELHKTIGDFNVAVYKDIQRKALNNDPENLWLYAVIIKDARIRKYLELDISDAEAKRQSQQLLEVAETMVRVE